MEREHPVAVMAAFAAAAAAGAMFAACDGTRAPRVVTAPAPAAPLRAAVLAEARAHGLTGEPRGAEVADDIASPLAQLGKQLFFSKHLSITGTVACASCHHPLLAGADGLSLPVGVGAFDPDVLGPGRRYDPHLRVDSLREPGPNVPRNSPTTFNIALYSRAMFHDGRLFVTEPAPAPNGRAQDMRTPESIQNLPDGTAGGDLTITQARFPVTSIHEMRGTARLTGGTPDDIRAEVVARLTGSDAAGRWLAAFRRAFRGTRRAPIVQLADLDYDDLAAALAAYQRSQLFIDSPWRRFLGGEAAALSPAAQRGALLFLREPAAGGFGCARCHAGDHFSDELFHIVATPQIGIGRTEDSHDEGRHAVTQREEDRYAFRTPSLLNVAMTAPYGHAGALPTLRDAVAHHLDPAASLARLRHEDLPQLRELGVRYAHAAAHDRAVLQALERARAAGRSRLPAARPATAQQLDDVVAFLEALTDPCTGDAACLAPWIPQPGDAFDTSILHARFGSFYADLNRKVLTPVPPPPRAASKAAPPASRPGRAPVCPTEPQPSPAPTGGTLFTEVAAQVGAAHPYRIDAGVWRKADVWSMEALMLTGGSAAGDVDGDCRADLVVTLGDRAVLLTAGADGTFAAADLRAGLFSGPAMADLDGDGDLDLFLAGMKHTRSVLLRNDRGIFTDWDLGARWPLRADLNTFGAAFADIDRDGDLDAFVARWDGSTTAFSPHLWINDGRGAFTPGDADWGLDVMYAGKGADTSFTPNFVDLDGDGWLDLVVAEDFERSRVFINTTVPGGGRRLFRDLTDRAVITDENGMGAAIFDADLDGDMDWFVTAIRGAPTFLALVGTTGNRLYLNDGKGHFRDATDRAGLRDGGWGWATCSADFDNDGRLDLYQVNGYGNLPYEHLRLATIRPRHVPQYRAAYAQFLHQPAKLFMGTATGRFREAAREHGADGDGEGRGISCFDHDRDGDIDVFIVDHAGSSRLLRNNARALNRHNFLTLRLWQNRANPHAIGATVAVTVAGRTSTHRIAHHNNYLSQNPTELHLGLGTATRVDQITVTWPDGATSRHADLPVNRFLTVERPEGE